MADKVDVLAVMDALIAAGREHPKDGGYYVTSWHNDSHAVMRMRSAGLGGRACGGEKVVVYGTSDEATAECDRLNGNANARAAVAELIEQQKRDAQLVAVLLSYLNDSLSVHDKSRLVTDLANRGLADHDAQRRAALARIGGA